MSSDEIKIVPAELSKMCSHSKQMLLYLLAAETACAKWPNAQGVVLLLMQRRLQASPYFIMDGTFDTSPNIFRQLYTIHGSVGVQQECAKILPLVYALMSEKSCEYYIRLFEEVSDFAASEECELAPQFIIADFEQAAITAARRVFPMATINGCYFHFGQSIWRKIQDTGLATRYGTDIEFAIRLRMLIGLAFLPPSEIPAAFAEVSRTIGDDADGGDREAIGRRLVIVYISLIFSYCAPLLLWMFQLSLTLYFRILVPVDCEVC